MQVIAMQVMQVYNIRVDAFNFPEQFFGSRCRAKAMRIKKPCLQPMQFVIKRRTDFNSMRLAFATCPAESYIAGMPCR